MAKMIIMSGISGAGKSTYANDVEGIVCSADDFFMKNGEYCFDPSKIGEAHEACMRKAIEAIEAGKNVVIDNTNTSPVEVDPYLVMAGLEPMATEEERRELLGEDPWTYAELSKIDRGAEYDLEIVQINGVTPEEAVERTVHGTPYKAIVAQAERIRAFPLEKFPGSVRVVSG